jgi:hypothetical protein
MCSGNPHGLMGQVRQGSGMGNNSATSAHLNKPKNIQNGQFLADLDILGLILTGKPMGLWVEVAHRLVWRPKEFPGLLAK